MMNERSPDNGTPIDLDELKIILDLHNLAGMYDTIRLVMELNNVETYEELFPLLQQRNAVGNFEVRTSDISTYYSIMENTHPELSPKLAVLVVSEKAMQETFPVLRMASQETRSRIIELFADEEKDEQEEAPLHRLAA